MDSQHPRLSGTSARVPKCAFVFPREDEVTCFRAMVGGADEPGVEAITDVVFTDMISETS